jgi:hypothetical protein
MAGPPSVSIMAGVPLIVLGMPATIAASRTAGGPTFSASRMNTVLTDLVMASCKVSSG